MAATAKKKKTAKPRGPRASAKQRKFIASLVERLGLAGELEALCLEHGKVDAVEALGKRAASRVIDALLDRDTPDPYRPATKKQLALIRKLAGERKVSRVALKELLEEVADGATMADLTLDGASAVIDELMASAKKGEKGAEALSGPKKARHDELWKDLEKIGWTAAWPAGKREQKRRALARLVGRGEAAIKKGMRGLLVDFWGEEVKLNESWYDEQVWELARASGRGFRPTKVRTRSVQGECEVSFALGGQTFRGSFETGYAADPGFYDLINEALKATGRPERFVPATKTSADLAFVSPAACKAAKRRRWF
jgi:hypothetical protein